MLKGLALTPPVLGRISIGKVIEKNGKRLPERMINLPSPPRYTAKTAGCYTHSTMSCAKVKTTSCAAFLCACCSMSRS